jgi:hypothetical protein
MSFDWWFRLVLDVLVGGMMGYWWRMIRRERRELREIAAMRARVEENLVRSTILLNQLDAFPGYHDDMPPPSVQ